MMSRSIVPLALLGVAAACGSAHGQDVVRTALSIDLARMRGTAEVEVRPARGEIVLDVSGLTVDEVRGPDGPISSRVEGGRLHIAARRPTVLTIAYRFQVRDAPEGLMRSGSTLTWPTRCSNLFPCRS